MTSLELFARCASGFERVLAGELKGLGMARVRPLKGGVAFFGGQRDAYVACLWSRVATRVQLVLARVACATADELYAGARAIAWERHIGEGATIAVEAHGSNASLRNTAFTGLKVKDAVCDRLREVRGVRPNVDSRHPDVAIDVAIHERKATIYLNLSGESLHRRGYREDGVQTEAPIKETLAAGMLLAAGWPGVAQRGGMLVDPMCGSGTIAIEGALIACHVAPGLLRNRWGFEGWAMHDELLWAELLSDAGMAMEPSDARVMAGDIDACAVEVARDNARRADVTSVVQLYVDDAAHLGRHLRGALKRGVPDGLLVTNPPYGERLSSESDLQEVHAALGRAVEALPEGWRCAVITPNASVDTALGRVPAQAIECHNGPIEVCVRLYDTGGVRRVHEVVSLQGVRHEVTLADERSPQFGARFRKVARSRLRWARANGIGCMRIYDDDMPEFRVSIDVFCGVRRDAGQMRALVQEHRRPKGVDAQDAARRVADAAALVGAVLDLGPSDVQVRQWSAKGPGRHESHAPLMVGEGGVDVEVDLLGHPDTGLPLQERGLRSLVRDEAAGGRFLNLFGTSAASAFAAAGGARQTLTVEPFADRAQRLRRTLDANGFAAADHAIAEERPMRWLKRAKRGKRRFDLILCDVPTWMQDLDRGLAAKEITSLLSAHGAVMVAGGRAEVAAWEREFAAVGLVCEDVTKRIAQEDFGRSVVELCCGIARRDGATPRGQ